MTGDDLRQRPTKSNAPRRCVGLCPNTLSDGQAGPARVLSWQVVGKDFGSLGSIRDSARFSRFQAFHVPEISGSRLPKSRDRPLQQAARDSALLVAQRPDSEYNTDRTVRSNTDPWKLVAFQHDYDAGHCGERSDSLSRTRGAISACFKQSLSHDYMGIASLRY
jgi:hypothetical protein